MADSDTGEKTEEPTPEKLRKAREQGQVSKSQDAVSALVFIGAFAVLAGTISQIGRQFSDLALASFQIARESNAHLLMTEIMWQGLKTLLLTSLPVVGAAFVMGFLSNYMQVGFLLTGQPLKPSFNKLNPINGFKQLFSMKRLVEMLKQIIKFVVVAFIVYLTIKSHAREIILAERMGLEQSVTVALSIIKDIVIKASAAFLLIAAADYFFQRYQFRKSMMMSMQDVKQEYKESEGDPHMKAERKRLAQELIMQGSHQNVKHADAVVTNPSHIAVAVQYDSTKHSAPVVVAKGLSLNAEKIKEIARSYDVPIIRNIPLAQALHKLDLEEEIPEELYEAVAEVLNFVYELKKKK